MPSNDYELEHASSFKRALPKRVWTAHIPPIKSQYRPLDGAPLWRALLALQFANTGGFIDSMAAPLMMSTLAKELDCSATIVWAAISGSIGSGIGVSFSGYISDQLGRRYMLLAMTAAQFAVNVGTGFVPNSVALFALRGLNGLIGGAVGNLIGASLSDYTPLDTRSRYQGLQGVAIILGGVTGIFGGSALAAKGLWRYLFWVPEAVSSALSFIMIFLWCPPNIPAPELKELWKITKSIDWIGLVSLCTTITSGLIVLSQAGRQWAVSDPRIIALIVICGIACIVFL